jgi:hypothetical protein
MATIDAAAWLLTLLVAIGCLGSIVAGRPALTLAILFAGAAFSGITAPLLTAGVRVEQPATALLAAYLLITHRSSVRRFLHGARVPIVLILLYLVVNGASAVLFAPNVGQSAKIAVWMAISALAALVAAVLANIASRAELQRAVFWAVAGTALIHSAVAALQVGAELAFNSNWGVLRSDAPLAKAFGLAWEPNLLSIHLAASLMIVLDPALTGRISKQFRLLATAGIAIGIALALSRGGIVALVAGALVIAAGVPRQTFGSLLRRPEVQASVVGLVIGVGGYVGLLALGAAGVGLRPGDIASRDVPSRPSLVPLVTPGVSVPVGTSSATGASASGPSASASPTSAAVTPGPTPSPREEGRPGEASDGRYDGGTDTLELRWRNLVVSVAGALTSPIIGLGPDTFGQRYLEPSCQCPAHIPNQLSATLYESGIIGLVSLIGALLWVVVRGWRAGLVGYVAALVALLIGFQFTDALRFGWNWILIGTITGLVVAAGRVTSPTQADTRESSPSHIEPK